MMSGVLTPDLAWRRATRALVAGVGSPRPA